MKETVFDNFMSVNFLAINNFTNTVNSRALQISSFL